MNVEANPLYSGFITHTIGEISTENIPAFDINPTICANGCLRVIYSLLPNNAELEAGITFSYQSDTSSTVTIQNLQDLSLGGDALNPIIYNIDIMIKDPRDHEYSDPLEKTTLSVAVINPCYQAVPTIDTDSLDSFSLSYQYKVGEAPLEIGIPTFYENSIIQDCGEIVNTVTQVNGLATFSSDLLTIYTDSNSFGDTDYAIEIGCYLEDYP